MAEIRRDSARTLIDYTARDYDSLLQVMQSQIPYKLPEWTDYTSEADFGNVLLQLFAHMGDILSYYQDRIANESFLGTAQTRRSIIDHLKLIGYTLSTAAPAAASLELRLPKAVVISEVVIAKGDAFATKSQKDQRSVRFEYTSETSLKIPFSDFTDDPKDGTQLVYVTEDKKRAADPSEAKKPFQDPRNPNRMVYPAGIPVEEGQLIRDEVIGISNGKANQRFTLAHAGLILRSLNSAQQMNRDFEILQNTLRVLNASRQLNPEDLLREMRSLTSSQILNNDPPNQDLQLLVEGDQQPWNLRESLAFSRGNQHDFVVEIDDQDRATIVFGNGELGAIPRQQATIRATYRIGGGAIGNVAANAITTIVAAPQLTAIGASITNPLPASGGAERESIDHAVTHAPRVFRSLKRAVTADDYKALALNFNGVSKVRAEATNWNTVTLYIAPDGGGRVSDVLRANLIAYFEDKRPITTRIEIEDVTYVPIYLGAYVEVERYYSRNDIREKVQTAAKTLLALENVDFGEKVYLSKFYEAFEAIDGLRYVTIEEFRRGEQDKPPAGPSVESSGKIELKVSELPTTGYPDGISLTIEGGT